jgi:hypothetical protein
MTVIDRAQRTGTIAAARRSAALAALAGVPAAHRRVLIAALRAPSAHNAQPWRIRLCPGARYELHYDHHQYLPADPDDRDAYLCMGTFCETLALAAQREGLSAVIEPVLERARADLHVADLQLRAATCPDPLAAHLAARATNRTRYTAEPLPPALIADLEALGCALVATDEVAPIVRKASKLSWQDRGFVADLDAWIRRDPASPDGMTPRQLGLARYEWAALRAAFRLGRLPAALAGSYGAREVRLLREAPAVAVLSADTDRPADLVEAGRRLLRAWVTICAAGFGYHPISVAIDRTETRPEIAALAGAAGTPVALFRIGRPTGPAGPSNRVQLAEVLLLPQ